MKYKLYNSYYLKEEYSDNFEKNIEYIFIGISTTSNYWFLFKKHNNRPYFKTDFKNFNKFGFNFYKIVKDLKLEKYLDNDKLVGWSVKTSFIDPNLKLNLKDKLKNILNR